MARGDYADIKLRTPAGVDKERIQATSAGSEIEVKGPARGELHYTVTEFNAGDPPVAKRVARFLASEVLSIIEGNEPVPTGVTKIKVGKS